jgi:hypothetical protein
VFSGYETFALLAALLLLQHGWPQGTVVRVMRQARPTLEPQHKRILSQDPKELFDQAEVLKQAAPSMIAVENTDPVFLAIVTKGGVEKARADAETGPIAVSACRGQEALMTFMRQEAPVGMSATFIELVGQAHRLAQHLAQTKPRARGRGSR